MASQVVVDGHHYRLAHVLGIGGQATVRYLEPMERGDEPLAMKVFKDPITYRAETRILNRIMGRGEHVNVITTIATYEPSLQVVMPWLSGGTLFQLIKRVQLTEQEIAFVLRQILNGLEALHSWKVIHCDIKPDNILLHPDGEPVISDFGLALVLGESMHGHGTKGFKCPEMAQAKLLLTDGSIPGPVTHKADVFAVPLIGIECVLDDETLYKQKTNAAELGLEKPAASERDHFIFNQLRSTFVSLQRAPPRLATFAGDTLTLHGQRSATATTMKNHKFIRTLADHGRAGFAEAVQLTSKLNEKKVLEHGIEEIEDRLRQAGTLRQRQLPAASKVDATLRPKKIDADDNAAIRVGRMTTKPPKNRESSASSALSEPQPPAAAVTRVSRKTTKVNSPKYRESSTSSASSEPHPPAATVTRASRKTTKGNPQKRRGSSSSSGNVQPRPRRAMKKSIVYKCPHANCPMKATEFTRKYDFEDHLKAHQGEYDCGLCRGKRLWSKLGWQKHVTSMTHRTNLAKHNAELNK